MSVENWFQLSGNQSGLFLEFPSRTILWAFTFRTAPFRNFPGIEIEWVAMLTDKPDAAIWLDR